MSPLFQGLEMKYKEQAIGIQFKLKRKSINAHGYLIRTNACFQLFSDSRFLYTSTQTRNSKVCRKVSERIPKEFLRDPQYLGPSLMLIYQRCHFLHSNSDLLRDPMPIRPGLHQRFALSLRFSILLMLKMTGNLHHSHHH